MNAKSHANVAIFVPHAGCPQMCSFCNQRAISGRIHSPAPDEARGTAARAMQEMPERAKPAQIAFFGGSFTSVDREYMVSLLQSVQAYIDGTEYTGIRISTRPDAIDKEILDILRMYRVTDIELGAQSMDDRVLELNRRGHTAGDTENAAELIRSGGFGLGLQMMTGLYGDSGEGARETARRLIALRPDCVRIYPAVTLRGTMLAELYEKGIYSPQTLDEAVDLCADLLETFAENGVPVIRLGLHDGPELRGNIVEGPYHPAFRELCESRILLRRALEQIRESRIPKGKISLAVEPRSISRMAGQKRENLRSLADMGYQAKIVPEVGIEYLQVQVFQRM